MIVIDVEQGSDLWFQEKLGKPSASNASMIITNDGKPSKQRDGYLYTLAAERLTGKQEETYKNGFMEMGNEREDESRKLFEMIHNVEVTKVGVVYRDEERKMLCSPDGIVKSEYGLELKNVLGKTQVKRLLDGDLPSEYFSQIQMSLFITGLPFWMFQSYAPGMRTFEVKVERDETFIKKLSIELEAFCKQLDDVTERLK